MLNGPTWTWEPIGLRESAVRLRSLKEWAGPKRSMGSRNRLYPYSPCLDFFGLMVDVVIQSLGQSVPCFAKVLGTDG